MLEILKKSCAADILQGGRAVQNKTHLFTLNKSKGTEATAHYKCSIASGAVSQFKTAGPNVKHAALVY